jgi:hypothetical protein
MGCNRSAQGTASTQRCSPTDLVTKKARAQVDLEALETQPLDERPELAELTNIARRLSMKRFTT